jgi:uncharacterized protein (DUF2141 family)
MRAVLLYLMFISAAHAATLVVTVRFVRNDRGHVRVAVCPRTMFLQPHCPWFANSPAHAGDVQVVIRNLPPGTYAAEAFHDENDNQILDRGFFGMPEEGMGFSNDARMHFGPPKFDQASFAVGGTDVAIRFGLKYY